MLHPVTILLLGMATVVGMIIFLRVNAFLALISAAMLVSLMAPGDPAEKIERVAVAFGSSAGKIGIVIAMAAVIGKCLMDSGAADRIVRFFLRMLGERQASTALMASGFVLSVPVFFDTVFYLLVPLARSLWKRTRKNYVLYIVSIVAGGVVTHALVPPTPGPLMVASILEIDLGWMIMIGALVAAPTALVSLAIGHLMNRLIVIPMRPYPGEPEPAPLPDDDLPGLTVSLLPVLLPVLLISINTVTRTVAADSRAASVTAVLGNANLALLLSAAIAMFILIRHRNLTRAELAKTMETALMSAGVMILITAAGGAFGVMLTVAGIGDTVRGMVGEGQQSSGLMLLVVGAAVAAMLKFAQGSSTVAMIATAGMLAGMGASAGTLGFHSAYLATAVGSGSLIGAWMNDSGFWIFARMGALTEVEALKTWTVMLAVVGIVGFGFTLLLAFVMPLV